MLIAKEKKSYNMNWKHYKEKLKRGDETRTCYNYNYTSVIPMYIISNETASFIEVKINMHSNFKEKILY